MVAIIGTTILEPYNAVYKIEPIFYGRGLWSCKTLCYLTCRHHIKAIATQLQIKFQ